MNTEEVFPKGHISDYKEEVVKRYKNYTLSRITFTSSYPLNFQNNDTVVVYHYKPKKRTKVKPVLILHGWKSITLVFEKLLSSFLVKGGYDTYLAILPFHFDRTPPGQKSGELYFTIDQFQSSNSFKQSVIDVRNIGDLISHRDSGINIVGSSLGAVVLHTLMGIDNRFSTGVSILGGGNIHRIVWEGLLGRFVVAHLKKRGITVKDYLDILVDYAHYREEIINSREIPAPRYHWYLLDPLTYAFFNHPRNVLMINGSFDLIIPKKSVLELYSALGKPEIFWLPAFHLTIFLFTPLILAKIRRFLEKKPGG
jgi:pimeloyl-ACP methyl ester carboxylesterase